MIIPHFEAEETYISNTTQLMAELGLEQGTVWLQSQFDLTVVTSSANSDSPSRMCLMLCWKNPKASLRLNEGKSSVID